MKKLISFLLCVSITCMLFAPLSVLAAAPTGLTWDGKPATLAEIAKNTGYDMIDAKGNYKPLYYFSATDLWKDGLFLGSNGCFDLDRPLTRAEGVAMIIRILGKDTEAKATTTPIAFTDVPPWAKPYVAYAVKNGIAKGNSATKFGSSAPMTAAQYITMVLRALGYKDGTDFTWDKSYDKALEIGLIGEPCHKQYSRSNLFLRDNAAVIAHNALNYAPMKSGAMLKDTITMPGKPTGSMPTATRDGAGSIVLDASTLSITTKDNYFQIYSLPGNNFAAVATYFLFVGTYRGPIEMKATLSPTGVGNTATNSYFVDFDDRPGEDLYIKYTFAFQVKPAAYSQMVTNKLKIQVGEFTYTDSIVCNGTLYSMEVV